MDEGNVIDFEEKYRENPEDVLNHCHDQVRFLVEVTCMVPLGHGLSFSERATSGFHYFLRDLDKTMKDSLEEMERRSREA